MHSLVSLDQNSDLSDNALIYFLEITFVQTIVFGDQALTRIALPEVPIEIP
jgi:hypothetical protein